MKSIKIEMKVDDIKRSEKGKDNCILIPVSDEPKINGTEATSTLTIKCDGVALFEDLGVPHQGSRIDIVLQDPAQTQLPSEEEEEV